MGQLTFARWRAVWCKSKSLSKTQISQDGVAYVENGIRIITGIRYPDYPFHYP